MRGSKGCKTINRITECESGQSTSTYIRLVSKVARDHAKLICGFLRLSACFAVGEAAEEACEDAGPGAILQKALSLSESIF